MTKTDFATTMGVDKSQVTRWVDLGMPMLSGGRIDGPKAATWVRAYVGDAQRNRRSNGARAIRAGEAMRTDEALDALTRMAVRLSVSMVPTLMVEIATEAKLSASQIRQLEALSRKRAPRIEAAVLGLLDIVPNAETGPLVRVTHPLAVDLHPAA